MMRIEIDTKKHIINITRATRAVNDAEFERKHPRDKDGKFETGSGITVRGNELGGHNMTKEELRAAAVDYYKKNLAGTSVKHPELGEVHFSQGGYRKPISFSADDRKLKLFPFLPDIIKQGKVIESEQDRDNRKNVQRFYVLSFEVHFGDKPEKVRITIRRDDKGNLYYDHVIAKKSSGSSPVHNTGRDAQGLSTSITDQKFVVNIFFEGE